MAKLNFEAIGLIHGTLSTLHRKGSRVVTPLESLVGISELRILFQQRQGLADQHFINTFTFMSVKSSSKAWSYDSATPSLSLRLFSTMHTKR